MKTKRSATWGLLAGAVACAAVVAMPGCELLVDFDRTKIPTGDASVADDASESPDAPRSSDAARDGTSPPLEAGPDASSSDAGPDSGEGGDGGGALPDTGTSDTGTDAPNEVGTGPDGSADASGDAGDGG